MADGLEHGLTQGWLANVLRSLSGVGLMLGTLFFAASLTPTLIPRTYLTQGVLAGACFAVGYAVGVFWRWLWRYMQLPELKDRARHIGNLCMAGACTVVALIFLWRSAAWQDSIRRLMGLKPVVSAHPLLVCLVAVLTFAILLALARLVWRFRWVARFVSRRIQRFAPPRVANVLGIAAAVLMFWSLASGVLLRTVLHGLDSSFRQADALFEPDHPQPASPLKTGSAASLIRWNELGRRGRQFVVTGPTAQEISTLTGRPAREPIRVYVGLHGADTPQARARLALRELIRVGAFDRSVLIAITPTGTGWIDPSSIDAVEYLHDGDVASVALQYSYLSSPLSLLIQPEFGAEAARAMFSEIYGYWTTLPKDHRPKLYLHGLSLGALNSETSAQLFEMIGDPISGALWTGPPFESRVWREITDNRNPGSPAWLPRFRDGSFVRFMDQDGATVAPNAPWGPMRIVYLQYASDPVTFFDYRDVYRRPAWMDAPRGPDVSPDLRWYPIVSMLQLGLDMAVATSAPIGHGHVYAPEHYVAAWMAVTDVRGWSDQAVARLARHLSEQARAEVNGDIEPSGDRGG